jgi:uncharacterized membrane protein
MGQPAHFTQSVLISPMDSYHHKPWSYGKHWFSDTWQDTKKSYGLLLGSILLGMVLTTMAQMIPVIGFLIGTAINGAVYIGIFYVAHRCILKQKTHIQDVFICFEHRRDAWLQSFIFGLFTLLFMIILALAMIIAAVMIVGAAQIQQQFTDTQPLNEMLVHWPLLIFVECLLLLLFVTLTLPMFYFAYPLIFFRKMGAWEAMMLSSKAVWSNAGSLTYFGLVALGIVGLGLLFLIVGVFFTMPWMYTAYIKSYHDIFEVPQADQTGLTPPISKVSL